MRMGMCAAHEGDLQQAWHDNVIDEPPLSAQEAIIFQPCLSGFASLHQCAPVLRGAGSPSAGNQASSQSSSTRRTRRLCSANMK